MKKNKSEQTEKRLVRAGLYIRVSGNEQKIKGLSIGSQQERLEKHCHINNWVIAGIYIDAAKTARKDLHKRDDFNRMINDVKQDKLDILVFVRLDRWFRSVADYYKIVEILEAHNCEWTTTDEKYDTTTSNGRLHINVKLSVAQNESDIGSERISVVFDSKVNHGTVLSGSCPFWLKKNDEKRLELIPENVAILQDAFNHFESTVSQRNTVKYIRETYGVNWCNATFRRMLKDKLVLGIYDKNGRYNENFCPPAISQEQFYRVQELLKRNVRHTPSGIIYIFTSILVCAECRHKLVGYRTGTYFYYRCNQHFHRAKCPHNRAMREDVIEKWLFENLENEIRKKQVEWEIRSAAKKRSASSTEKASLKRKLTKLKELYVNDLIDIEEYKKDYEIYTSALQKIQESVEEIPPDFTEIQKLLDSDFKKIYNSLTREEKRTLWRSVIKEIVINNDREITGISFA